MSPPRGQGFCKGAGIAHDEMGNEMVEQGCPHIGTPAKNSLTQKQSMDTTKENLQFQYVFPGMKH